MSREGQAIVAREFNFAGDKLLLSNGCQRHGNVEMLGLTPQNHLQKFLSLLQLRLRALNLPHLEKNQNGQDQVTLLRKIFKHGKRKYFHPYKSPIL
jgi:hypothetical protein